MAHFKRRKCRYRIHRAIRGSRSSWRARHGFKPVVVTLATPDWFSRYTSAAWDAMWHPRRWHGNRGKKIGGPDSMMSSYPRVWDLHFHTRPRRVQTRRLERAVLTGRLDPDNTVWPLGNNRPHTYYW